MISTTTTKSSNKLILAFPLLFVLLPRPELQGAQFLTYPAILLVLLVLGLLMTNVNELKFNKNFVSITTLLFLYMLSISSSLLFNSNNLSIGSFAHIFKPVLFLSIICFGYIVGKKCNIEIVKIGLLKSAYIILAFQTIVGITQLFDISVFGWIYSDYKTRPLGQIVRIAGTLANPNIFAWIVIQMVAIIYLFEINRIKKFLWLIVGFGLVVFSGSRSLLILTPIILVFINIMLSNKNASFFLVKVPKYLSIVMVSFIAAYIFIQNFGDVFPYLNELLLIVNTGELTSINSFNARTIMWENALSLLNENKGIITLLFGLGPGSIPVLDNDYLYSFINYGLLTTSINILIYVFFYVYLSKLKDRNFSILGKQYILFSLIIGYQVETISGWNYPLLIMFYMGIVIAKLGREKLVIR